MTTDKSLVAALDQGTTSTRCILFDHDGREVARAQLEHAQILPRPGWVEHDPAEIWRNSCGVIRTALDRAGIRGDELVGLGIANQRETTLLWNRHTGVPYGNAIVWQDTRTDQLTAALSDGPDGETIRRLAGIPAAPYFSAGKAVWIIQQDPQASRDVASGDAIFGTIDTWLLWNLTGGPDGGVHLTDVTNASRTMLMNLETLDWDPALLAIFDLPIAMLPSIVASAHPDCYGRTRNDGPFGAEVPILGALGDQQAAMVGQVCLEAGEAKNTYGTGNFLLLNTGAELVRSGCGLLSTVCYQFGDQPPVYALEGSVAVTGSAIQWLRDQLGLLSDASESESLAASVPDCGDVYLVPAFSGLFAPRWRSDARGAIVGLTRFASKAHLARAALEAICYQSREVVDAMIEDSGLDLDVLKVDGGVTVNALCMQIQADVLGVEVSLPEVAETTALGAAYAAGLAAGFWSGTDELRQNWHEARRWRPAVDAVQRERGYLRWQQAVERTLGWVDVRAPN